MRLASILNEERDSIRRVLDTINAQERSIRESLAHLDSDAPIRQAVGRVAEQTRAFSSVSVANEKLASIIARETEEALALHRAFESSMGSIVRVAEISFAAQERIAALRFESIGDLAGFDATARNAAATRFSTLAESYERLMSWISIDSSHIGEMPEALIDRPSRELLDSADTLIVFSSQPDRDIRPYRFADDLECPVSDLLAELHPDLPAKLAGAVRVLGDESNPDRIAQASNSLVELIDHALRLAAPDDDVMSWTQQARHYADEERRRPTRAARWEFLTRNLGEAGGALQPFLEADLNEIRGLLKTLQGGKHTLAASISPDQAKVLLTRVHGVARTLVIVWKIGRG